MKFLSFDSDSGQIRGWYDSIISAGSIPDDAVEISDDNWLDAITNNYNCYDSDSETFSLTDFSTDDEIEQATYKTEYDWSVSELSDTDTEVAKCTRGSSRSTATLNEWYAYQEALCDYAHYSSDDGYSITDMTDIDEDSDDYTFKYTFDDTEYIVSVDSDTGRPVAPT